MNYFMIPIISMIIIAVICLNFKIGFWISDLTEDTGFNIGFYLITLVGLITSEIMLLQYLFGDK